jgi:hypothetical protein
MSANSDFGTWGRYKEIRLDKMTPGQKRIYQLTMMERGPQRHHYFQDHSSPACRAVLLLMTFQRAPLAYNVKQETPQ